MSVEGNKAIYRQYLERCNAHEFATLDEFVDRDVRVNGHPLGLDQYQEGLQRVVDAFPDYHWHLDQLLGEGDYLAARFTDSGTHQGIFLMIAPSGTFITTQEFAFYHVVDGKIAEVWVTADNLSTLLQISGMMNPYGPSS
jgi:aspartyl-tRNA synthetase